MKKTYLLILLSFILHLSENADAQLSITGATCVLPGTEYQYLINGDWSVDSSMQICVQGGRIIGTVDSCLEGAVAEVHIIWDSSLTHNLYLSYSASHSNLGINITTPLTGGTIDSVTALQTVLKNKLPVPINCSEATGGSCLPNYSLSWQQSNDGIHWTDIPGMASSDLIIENPVQQTTYYRRRVTDLVSRSIEYSNTAIIAVIEVTTQVQ